MENHQYDVQVEKPDEWVNLWHIGDWHLGSIACDEERIDKDINRIRRSKNPHVILQGDLLNAICYRDKRFDPADIHQRHLTHLGDIFRWQLKDVKERVAILEPYVIGAHCGNHEHACSKYYQYDPHAELLETFPKIRDFENTAIVKIRVFLGKKMLYYFTVFTCHRLGNIKTMLNFMNRCKHFEGDIKVMGHNHQLDYKRVDALKHREGEQGGDVADDPKLWGFSGSYLRTYASGLIGYGDRAGYEPIAMGCLNVKVRRDIDNHHRIEFDPRTT